MTKHWWKILAAALLVYSFIAGLLVPVPRLPILHETIRNLYFHVPMWFTMLFLYLLSVVNSVKYLSSGDEKHDFMAVEQVNTGIVFGFLGLGTGMIWANFTWGAPWPNDPKLNSAAISTLMYLAYIVLRNSIDESQKEPKYRPFMQFLLSPLWWYYCLYCPA